MAHINLPEGLPGIRGPMAFSPDTAKPLAEFTEILLRGENSLLRGERELIGTYVSALNDCYYCMNAHAGIAQHYLQCDTGFIDQLNKDYNVLPLSPKMKTLLAIAGSVQQGGKFVTAEQVEAAKAAGATDKEIHDTVLIAAAFCMFNRYVDGLATDTPTDRQQYIDRGPQRAIEGYFHFNPYK